MIIHSFPLLIYNHLAFFNLVGAVNLRKPIAFNLILNFI